METIIEKGIEETGGSLIELADKGIIGVFFACLIFVFSIIYLFMRYSQKNNKDNHDFAENQNKINRDFSEKQGTLNRESSEMMTEAVTKVVTVVKELSFNTGSEHKDNKRDMDKLLDSIEDGKKTLEKIKENVDYLVNKKKV